MPKDPWTDPDPQPGDFDEYVRTMDPRDIQYYEGNSGAKVTIVANAEDEDANPLRRRRVRVPAFLSDLLN